MSYKKRQVIKTNIPVMKGLDSLLIAFIVLEQYLAYSTCYVSICYYYISLKIQLGTDNKQCVKGRNSPYFTVSRIRDYLCLACKREQSMEYKLQQVPTGNKVQSVSCYWKRTSQCLKLESLKKGLYIRSTRNEGIGSQPNLTLHLKTLRRGVRLQVLLRSGSQTREGRTAIASQCTLGYFPSSSTHDRKHQAHKQKRHSATPKCKTNAFGLPVFINTLIKRENKCI